MPSPRPHRQRPRFHMQLSIPVEEALEGFEELLREGEERCQGHIRNRHVMLRVLEQERHLWSPHLDLELSPAQEGKGTIVHGLIGPSPAVWTCFIAGYATFTFLGIVALILGYVQWSTGQSPWGFFAFVGLVPLLLGWYGVSQLGQRFAREQIEELREILFRLLEPWEEGCD